MQSQRDVIDLQDLLDKAKAMPIKLIANEWYEIEGNPLRYPGTNTGYEIADRLLQKQFPGEGYHYVRQEKIHFKQEGRPMYDIVADLNEKLKELGIEPQEGGFSYQYYDWQTPEEQRSAAKASMMGIPVSTIEWQRRNDRDNARPLPLDYQWLAVYPVTGNSEGYYIHVDLIHQQKILERPCVAVIRELIKRVDGLPYDAATYQPDKDLVERAKAAVYGEPGSHRTMLALAKTWEWDNACACSAVAARLLGA